MKNQKSKIKKFQKIKLSKFYKKKRLEIFLNRKFILKNNEIFGFLAKI